MLKHRAQAGDTLIEVLLCIAVVSSVLGGAYVTVRNGLDNSRQSQERSEGLKHVESQLEQLRLAAADTPNLVYSSSATPPQIDTAANDFCLDVTNTPVRTLGSGGHVSADFNLDNFSSYVSSCKLAGVSNGYNISITRTGNDFIVRARWERAGGGRDQVEVRYRLLQ